jgi:signal transduction histidine kinase
LIIVEDDGEGYSPDILTRIGEPYVTKRQREDSAGGLGLGLFIAKTLLERSGAVLILREPRAGERRCPGSRRMAAHADRCAFDKMMYRPNEDAMQLTYVMPDSARIEMMSEQKTTLLQPPTTISVRMPAC